jgi:NAD(P)-dependent dehydrogenase (short-subunit alcohol dehydrogenase family)
VAVVLLTGGTSGIGLATAHRLAAAGDDLFIVARRPERGDLPDGCTTFAMDVADPSAAESAVAAVVDRAGRLDALINNAGTGPIAPFEEMDDAEVARIFEVNVFGPLRLMRTAIPVMRDQGGGRIVNVSSLNDTLPAVFASIYSATKAALANASVAIDAEVHGFGISVSVIAPGLFRSAMADALAEYDFGPDSLYRAASNTLQAQNRERLGGAGDPDDVARVIFDCVHGPTPPARVVVGLDALGMEKLVRGASSDDVRQMLRDYCTQLTETES